SSSCSLQYLFLYLQERLLAEPFIVSLGIDNVLDENQFPWLSSKHAAKTVCWQTITRLTFDTTPCGLRISRAAELDIDSANASNSPVIRYNKGNAFLDPWRGLASHICTCGSNEANLIIANSCRSLDLCADQLNTRNFFLRDIAERRRVNQQLHLSIVSTDQ